MFDNVAQRGWTLPIRRNGPNGAAEQRSGAAIWRPRARQAIDLLERKLQLSARGAYGFVTSAGGVFAGTGKPRFLISAAMSGSRPRKAR